MISKSGQVCEPTHLRPISRPGIAIKQADEIRYFHQRNTVVFGVGHLLDGRKKFLVKIFMIQNPLSHIAIAAA